MHLLFTEENFHHPISTQVSKIKMSVEVRDTLALRSFFTRWRNVLKSRLL